MSIREVDVYIDSKNRNKFYKNILTSDIYYLNKDPISIIKNKKILEIEVKNHSLMKDDLIIIENVISNRINDIFNIRLDKNILKIDISQYKDLFVNFLEYEIIFNISNKNIFNVININTIEKINKINIEENIFLIINLKNNYYSNINLEILELTFIFKDFNNIKLNNINSNYPIDENHNEGFKIINDTKDDYIYIEISDIAIKDGKFGGNNIMINKINFQEKGYENSNYFEINLFKIFYNVISIKMISYNFPKLIKTISEEYKTNKLSWLDEERNIYNIDLEDSYEIINSIIEKINNTKIINSNNYFLLKKNIDNEIFFDFTFYSKIILYEALSKLTLLSSQSELLLEKINVYYPNHNLKDDDEILIENAISFEGIPEEVLNSKHYIKIIDTNNFYFNIGSYNIKLSTLNTKNNGGKNIFLLLKKKIKIVENNLTQKLGIRNYNFSFQIKNEIPLHLNESYFYVNTIINNGDECVNNFTKNGLTNILSKVYLDNDNSISLYDIDTRLYFEPSIKSLYKILFSYEYEDGSLVNFYNLESNFVLRISYLDI